MAIKDSIKNAGLVAGGHIPFFVNAPGWYSDKQYEYFNDESKTFTQLYARYSSDYVEARVQGLDPKDPCGWQTRMIRMADVVRPSAAILRRADNYKMVLFADRDVQYIQPGTKIITMGSTWICTNPFNISGSDGSGIVQRCNAVWKHLDWYGNVLCEPIVMENVRANANDSDSQQSQYITKGYFNVIAQYNDSTRQIDTNTRMILGTGAYRVTGYSDFETEFTGDYGTVRLLSFTVRYEEPNEAIDDMERHVAGGKTFSWEVGVLGTGKLSAGQQTIFTAKSLRNGQDADNDTEHDTEYLWRSSDERVATVDAFGLVTAVSEGEATITATLAQNTGYSASYTMEVTESEDGVAFTCTVPDSLGAYETALLTAAYYEDGQITGQFVTFTFSGADRSCYATEVTGNSVIITCYGHSATPLTVTAAYGDKSESVTINLEGI